VASATYELFRQAILEEKQVTCVYNGHRREVCPHIIGHTGGDEKVLAFQFAGETSTRLPPGGEWRCLFLARVQDVGLRDGPWHAGSEHRTTHVNVHVRGARPEASAGRMRGARSRSRRS